MGKGMLTHDDWSFYHHCCCFSKLFIEWVKINLVDEKEKEVFLGTRRASELNQKQGMRFLVLTTNGHFFGNSMRRANSIGKAIWYLALPLRSEIFWRE